MLALVFSDVAQATQYHAIIHCFILTGGHVNYFSLLVGMEAEVSNPNWGCLRDSGIRFVSLSSTKVHIHLESL